MDSCEHFPYPEFVVIKRQPRMTITLSWEPDPQDLIKKKCEDYPNCEECKDD